MATQEEVDRGRDADLLLSNPVFQKAWSDLKQDILSQWMRTQADDVNGRERCHVAVILLQRLQDKFAEYVNAGVMASDTFDKQRRKPI